MESFYEMLTAGGHMNSLGRSNEVLKSVQDNPNKMDELFNCIFAEDAWVRMRAIDTFEKLVKEKPDRIQIYLPSIFKDLTKSNQASIQWHLAQLFTEAELTTTQQELAIKWLKERIADPDVDWIVSVNAMKALLYFHDKGLVSGEDLLPLFEVQNTHESKSVRKKARMFLELLEKKP